MKIDTNNIFSISEANQNFSKIAKAVDKNGSVVILKNNKPKYIIQPFDSAKQEITDDTGESKMKTLVAYFSASGVTKGIAEKMAEKIGADTYEIKPVVPYTDADLNWMDKNSRSTFEMKDKSSRPEIIKGDIDVSKYDRILLGYPVWWYTAPTIVNTFLETYDFSGKVIVIWATSGGSGLGNAKDDLAKSTTATIKNGKILNTPAQLEQFSKEIITT